MCVCTCEKGMRKLGKALRYMVWMYVCVVCVCIHAGNVCMVFFVCVKHLHVCMYARVTGVQVS